jgi:hypothetical protein
MAGPVIITDDGGPPLYDLEKSGEFRMKTGRFDEDMPQLLKANSPHTLKDAYAISRVEVSQGGESKLVAYSPKKVTVTSAESKDTIVVQTIDNGTVNIESVQALTDVSEMPWGVYATVQMGYISVIQIDNILMTTGGDSTRVSVYLS